MAKVCPYATKASFEATKCFALAEAMRNGNDEWLRHGCSKRLKRIWGRSFRRSNGAAAVVETALIRDIRPRIRD
jgi:hypothetical protein